MKNVMKEVFEMNQVKKIMMWMLGILFLLVASQFPSISAHAESNQEDNQDCIQFDQDEIYLDVGVHWNCVTLKISKTLGADDVQASLTNEDVAHITACGGETSDDYAILKLAVKALKPGTAYYTLTTNKNSSLSKTLTIHVVDHATPDSDSDSTTPDSQQCQHTHHFTWVTVQEATVSQDGLEELRCDECGFVEETCIIPSSQAFVQEFHDKIRDAAANSEISFDSGTYSTISDYLIKMFQERNDVSAVINFEYDHQNYRMTIPAGADYTNLINDESYFYGYFFFANEIGATIECL